MFLFIIHYCRLYCKGRLLGYKRGKSNQSPNTSLVQIENVTDLASTEFYLGKRVAFVYRGKKSRAVLGKGNTQSHEKKSKSSTRVIWGKITRSHGNSGVVKAQFRTNLPPIAFGASVRVVINHSFIYEYFDIGSLTLIVLSLYR